MNFCKRLLSDDTGYVRSCFELGTMCVHVEQPEESASMKNERMVVLPKQKWEAGGEHHHSKEHKFIVHGQLPLSVYM